MMNNSLTPRKKPVVRDVAQEKDVVGHAILEIGTQLRPAYGQQSTNTRRFNGVEEEGDERLGIRYWY